MKSSSSSSAQVYEIRIGGHLDARWATSFDGMTLTPEVDGTTVVRGVLADQAALHGVLQRFRDAGLALISITQIDAEQGANP